MIIISYDSYEKEVLRLERVFQTCIPVSIQEGLITGEIRDFHINVNFPRKRRSILVITGPGQKKSDGTIFFPDLERSRLTKNELKKRIGFECLDALRRDKVSYLQVTSHEKSGKISLVKLAQYYS